MGGARSLADRYIRSRLTTAVRSDDSLDANNILLVRAPSNNHQGDRGQKTYARRTRAEIRKNFGLDGEPSKKKPTKCTMIPEELTEYYMKFRLGRQKKEDGSSD